MPQSESGNSSTSVVGLSLGFGLGDELVGDRVVTLGGRSWRAPLGVRGYRASGYRTGRRCGGLVGELPRIDGDLGHAQRGHPR